GLADLMRVGDVARVDSCARSAHGRAERVGELLDEHELLLRAETTAARDDLGGTAQLGAGRRLLDRGDLTGSRGDGTGCRDLERLDHRGGGLGPGIDRTLAD